LPRPGFDFEPVALFAESSTVRSQQRAVVVLELQPHQDGVRGIVFWVDKDCGISLWETSYMQ
jgi:hypothetical protein